MAYLLWRTGTPASLQMLGMAWPRESLPMPSAANQGASSLEGSCRSNLLLVFIDIWNRDLRWSVIFVFYVSRFTKPWGAIQ